MSHRVEKTLVVAVPVARAWRAFADSRERSQWEAVEFEIDPRPGGRVRWTLPGMECRGRVVEVEPERLLRHTEGSGPHAETEVAVRFEPVGARTRISVTHSGFGEGDDAAFAVESVSLGWTQALADLVVYLERGVPAGRFVRRMLHAGLQVTESTAGLEVRAIEPGGFAERAGLQPGDLLLALGGVPIYTRPELWVVLRGHAPGDKLTAEYARDGDRLSGAAAL